MINYNFIKVNYDLAAKIIKWVYAEPYEIYSFDGSQEAINELLSSNYYAVLNVQDELIGYFCFGTSAQIPTVEKDVYLDKALDIGLGMKPEFCGQGRGLDFVLSGLSFAKNT